MTSRCTFVPPYLLRRIAGSAPEVADHCTAALSVDEGFRTRRTAHPLPQEALSAAVAGAAWTIHTAEQGTTLPGRPVRTTGQPRPGRSVASPGRSKPCGTWWRGRTRW